VIVAIDDTPQNLSLLDDMLGRHGVELVIATDGETGLKRIVQAQQDLVLLDIMMPGIDGFEVCQRIQADPAIRDIPVLILTALSDEADILRAFSVGAADYVTKPIRHEEVIARITTHLRLHRQRCQLVDSVEQVRRESAEKDRMTQERDAIQQQLIASAKMVSLAEFSSGIAHNIGNAINGAVVASGMLENDRPGPVEGRLGTVAARIRDPDYHMDREQIAHFIELLAEELDELRLSRTESVTVVRSSLGHVTDILSWQMQLAHQKSVSQVVLPVDLAHNVVDLVASHQRRSNTRITVSGDDGASLPVALEAHKIAMILVNLAINATQAMDGLNEEDRVIALDVQRIDDRLLYRVIDHGRGIDLEAQSQLFTYGFSTRSKGNGFGLHNSRLLAKGIGAELELESSEAGKGSTFLLSIPIKRYHHEAAPEAS
jgi:DNA-binding response OmpR family regulator/anti-sigma regulatory factor (Ser/Thr protein kinase)